MPPYILTLGFIKASILCQYLRVFNSFIRQVCFGMLVVVTLTSIAFLLVFSFQCTPTRAFWDITLRGRCINIATINFAFLSINVATDIILIIIPIPIFKNLKMRKAEKRSLIFIFALGAFAAVTCLLRIPYVIIMNSTKDSTYHNHGLIIWSRVELNVAIVCACLPALRVPLARWFPKMWRRSVETLRHSRQDLSSEPATERWSDEAGDSNDDDSSGGGGGGGGSLSKLKRAIRASFAAGEESQENLGTHRASIMKLPPPPYPAPPADALDPQGIRVYTIFTPRITPQPYIPLTPGPPRKASRDFSSVGSPRWSSRPGGGKRVTYSTQASGSQRSSPVLEQVEEGSASSPQTEWRCSNVTTLAEFPVLFVDDGRLDDLWSQITQDPIWSRNPI